jgi:hypothetical protein
MPSPSRRRRAVCRAHREAAEPHAQRVEKMPCRMPRPRRHQRVFSAGWITPPPCRMPAAQPETTGAGRLTIACSATRGSGAIVHVRVCQPPARSRAPFRARLMRAVGWRRRWWRVNRRGPLVCGHRGNARGARTAASPRPCPCPVRAPVRPWPQGKRPWPPHGDPPAPPHRPVRAARPVVATGEASVARGRRHARARRMAWSARAARPGAKHPRRPTPHAADRRNRSEFSVSASADRPCVPARRSAGRLMRAVGPPMNVFFHQEPVLDSRCTLRYIYALPMPDHITRKISNKPRKYRILIFYSYSNPAPCVNSPFRPLPKEARRINLEVYDWSRIAICNRIAASSASSAKTRFDLKQ